MQELKINVENDQIAEAFKNFIVNYKTNIADYMNQLVANDGSPCDSEIVIKDGELTVYHVAPDKGFVLGETGNEALPVQVMQYQSLENDKRYILPERDKLILFLKQELGTPDIRLGAFKALSDVILGFDSQPVKLELERVADMKKAKKREDDRTKSRLERLAKIEEKIEDVKVEEEGTAQHE